MVSRASASVEPRGSRLRQRRWPWLVACAIATVCVVIFLRAFDLREIAADIRRADPVWMAVAVLANFAVLPLMTQQWRMLLPGGTRVRWRDMWERVTLSVACMNTVPFGGGHAIAVGLLSARKLMTVQGAVSLLALEQLCEGLSRLALIGVTLAGATLPPMLEKTAWGLAAIVIVGFGALLYLARQPTNAAATGWRARFGHHLEVLRRPRVFVPAAALSLVIKACAILAVYAVQRSLGANVSLASTPLVLAVVLFTTGVAVAPGNVGVYEFAAIGAYHLLGISSHEAAPLGLLLHVCFIVPVIGTGYGLLIWRTLRPTPTELPQLDAKEG
jgi:uncharacterized membrane protein YbhN (UPF0104 family)